MQSTEPYIVKSNNRFIHFAVAFCAGALLTIAFSPFDFILALPFAFIILLVLLDNVQRSKFWTGFCFGYGHFLTSLYWITYSILDHFREFLWVIPFVLVLLPFCMSLFIGIVAVLADRFKQHRVLYVISFATIWVIGEIIRSYLVLPFPWNLLGYTASSSIYLAQIASIVGVHFLSWIMCIFATSIYSKNKTFISCTLVALISIYCYGYWRVNNQNVLKVLPYKIYAVQPNFKGTSDVAQKYNNLRQLLNLSQTALTNDPIMGDFSKKSADIIVWPEAALPFGVYDNSDLYLALATILPKNGYLITGVDRIEATSDTMKFYNSIIVLNNIGDIKGVYDKRILVPFGEYIPFRHVLPNLIQKVVPGLADFSHGNKTETLTIGDTIGDASLKVLPLVCYESIFPYLISSYDLKDVALLLNLTNNNWFGESMGPHHHFMMTRMRAIEFGISTLIVSNTGPSAMIDPMGRLVQTTEINSQATFLSQIPTPSLSFYAQCKYCPLYLLVVIVFGMLMSRQIILRA
ncbi:apolipoprotein N-acyltransferase [Rickettsiales endosymbiont of Peranema trichophorum]|uniref:apolipoprotein N-acyltransferase n=1 Tax=Rickettsiales endosymbiont of Peranema trichophorum TaxID=2486577 RepID=UPI001023973F|nr:apolipoprotein N-acyltransferase [Rickettsiales endosymbiont of Peranema trichophorum]RZI46363.1 apolipoprotein N-acyltransferase [Rickettsiales endosymbiont of Peranema trichophorum]